MVEVVVVGSGHAAALHGAAVEASPLLRLAGHVVRHPGAPVSSGRDLGTRRLGLDEVTDDVGLAVIATPPTDRLGVCTALAARDIGLLVESPPAVGSDIDRLTTLPTPLLAIGANVAHAPLITAMRERLDVAAVTHVGVTHHRPRPAWGGYPDASWGAGVLYDLGVPAVALALTLAPAAPRTVSASVRLDNGVDVAAVVNLTLDNGSRVVVDVAWNDVAPRLDAQAATPTSALRAELLPGRLLEHNGDTLALPDDRRLRHVAPALVDLGYVAQVEAAARMVTDGGAPLIGVALGSTAVQVVAAAAVASTGVEPIELADLDGDRRTPAELLDRS